MRAFFLTTVRWGAFHGDVHAGNMMLLRDGRIGVIDWGIVGRLDPVDAPLLHLAAVGGHGRRVGLADGDRATSPTPTGRPSAWRSGMSDEELTGVRPQHHGAGADPALRRGQPGRHHADDPARRWPRRRASRPTSAASGRSCTGCAPSAGCAAWPTSRAA